MSVTAFSNVKGENEASGSDMACDALGVEREAEVLQVARRVRAALESGDYARPGLRSFPRGACGDASRLLGLYLEALGLGKWTYVQGEAGGEMFATHAWLEQDGLIVDITADQFDDVTEAVIVTRDRGWHDRRFPPVRHSSMWLAPTDVLLVEYETLWVVLGPA